jgi:4-hydroxy-2-oxoheptanedioate aldolase
VRVSHLEGSEIGRALEAGPDGVMVPNVTGAAEADAAVRAAHYPPRGVRGAAPTGRAAEATRRWAEAGVGLVTVSNATAIFTEAAGTLLAAARGFDRG